jgi:hypothetical protein
MASKAGTGVDAEKLVASKAWTGLEAEKFGVQRPFVACP